jgi:hypothetical protein
MAKEQNTSADAGASKAEPRPEPAQQKATEQPAPVVPTKTPDEWARALGHFKKAPPHQPQKVDAYSPDHARADALFKWSDHAAAYQAPEDRFVISEGDYLEALRTAAHYPLVAPHAPALPPSRKAHFANFKHTPASAEWFETFKHSADAQEQSR